MSDANESAGNSRVFGIWFGGQGSYTESQNPRDVEVFENEEVAKDALVDRYAHGHWREHVFNYVNKARDEVRTPAVGEDCRIDIYLTDPSGEFDATPDYVLALAFDDEHECEAVRQYGP